MAETDSRVFMCIWGSGYSGCDEKARTELHKLGAEGLFTDKNGFEPEEIKQIAELELGRSIELLTSGNLSIVRIL